MLVASISDFRKDIKSYIDKVISNLETLIIHRGKNQSVVVISLEEYNKLTENQKNNIVAESEASYTISEAEREAILQGLNDVKNGKIVSHEEVMKRFDKWK